MTSNNWIHILFSLTVCSLSPFSSNYWLFLLGRGIGGLAIGMLHFLIPFYINDMVPANMKSLCRSIMQFQFVLGILSQYILSKYCWQRTCSFLKKKTKITSTYKSFKIDWNCFFLQCEWYAFMSWCSQNVGKKHNSELNRWE